MNQFAASLQECKRGSAACRLATKEANEASRLPTAEELAEMGKYQEEMVKAGVLLPGEGLRLSSLGARMKFVVVGKHPHVIAGPFTESKELIASFSILQVRSKAEAIEAVFRLEPA